MAKAFKGKKLSLEAKFSDTFEGCIKKGHAEVELTSFNHNSIIFQEKGFWYKDQLPESAFKNSFRWSLDLEEALISLEHLRYGIQKPVFLFHLTTNTIGSLESVGAHLCNDDTYLGNIVWNKKRVTLNWRIIGPNKNYFLTYYYV